MIETRKTYTVIVTVHKIDYILLKKCIFSKIFLYLLILYFSSLHTYIF